jgi:hypothetical protein
MGCRQESDLQNWLWDSNLYCYLNDLQNYETSNLDYYLNVLQNWLWDFKSRLLFEWLTELTMSFQMSIAIWVTYRTHYGISNLYWYLNDLQNWIWEFKSWLLFEWLTELGDFNSQLLFEWLKNWLWNFKYHCYLNDLQTDYGISNLEAIWVTYRTMRLEVSIGIWMTYRTDFGISNIDCYLNDFQNYEI